MIQRNAVRAVLLRETDQRILLLKARLPERDLELWLTPGGGIESGESTSAALIREVHEETGLRIAGHQGWIWQRHHRFVFHGDTYDQHESFYLVRIPPFQPVHDQNPAAHEQEMFERFQWWSVDEIKTSQELFVPRSLGIRLETLLTTGGSSIPYDVGV